MRSLLAVLVLLAVSAAVGAAEVSFAKPPAAARSGEQIAITFTLSKPSDVEVAVLRFAPILGPTVSNLYTRFLARPIAPVMMGHDPLMQFVHEQDAANALQRAVESHAIGAFNIVGKGVLPYTTVLALLGRVPLPMPQLIARQLTKVLWTTQLVGSPPSFLDFLLYLCVADGNKARRELGFSPRMSIKRTILDFLGIAAEDGATDVATAQA